MTKKFTGFLIILIAFSFFYGSNRVEKVNVNWWVVPLFTVYKDNSPVLDLRKDDIKLFINDRQISDFIIYKRPFYSEGESVKKIAKKKFPERDKIIILLFDTVYSNLKNLEKCKSIAREIVKKSDKNSKFVILKVDLFSGLKYVFGPSNDKGMAIKMIDKEIEMTSQGKSIENIMIVINAARLSEGGSKSLFKYTESEIGFLKEETGMSLKATSRTFFLSFETLYFALNQIKDNKFIYLFSEGIPYFARKIIRHSDEEFSLLMKKSASLLGRSSSVIFIINPATTTERYEQLGYGTGEDILKSLAKESGGEYFEGTKEFIKEKISNLNISYYEIAFPDSSGLREKVKTVRIETVKRGLKINTIKSIEKSKNYSEMNKLEKEILVLNLLKKHTFINIPLKVDGIEFKRIKGVDSERVDITLPKEFTGKYIDVFRVEENSKSGIKIEKRTIFAPKRKISLKFKIKEKLIKKIVIISRDLNRALVEGRTNFNKKIEKILKSKNLKFMKKMKNMTPSQNSELSEILKGTSEYCKKLKNSIFYFVCIEDVKEKRKELRVLREKKSSKYNYDTGVMINKREPDKISAGNIFWNRASRYVFDYQLIQDGKSIKEERKLKKGAKKKIPAILKGETFISKKIVMIPLAIFSAEHQKDYLFRFIKKRRIKGIDTAEIEVFPKNFSIAGSIYGKIWIDLSNYSLFRMFVNPVSIGGFGKILEISENLGSFVDLRTTIEFGKKWNDLRFPTSVKIVERHYGGWLVKRILRRKFFERTKTEYKYKNYRFFNVKTDVKIKND